MERDENPDEIEEIVDKRLNLDEIEEEIVHKRLGTWNPSFILSTK